MVLLVLLTLPVIAYVTMVGFVRLNWMTLNYEKEQVPYSLGVFILYTYIAFAFLSPIFTPVFSIISFIYVMGVWATGLLDDLYGEKETKGLKGHVKQFLRKGIISTGLLKLIGTVVFTTILLLYLQPTFWYEWLRYGLILLLTPHVMNLFDTRPLRVWKVSLLYGAFFLPLLEMMPFFIYLFLLSFFFVFYVMEGHKVAMLGDNGATLIGAILGLLTIFHATVLQQWLLLSFLILLTVIAERISFSRWIEKSKFLRVIDQWGINSSK